MKGTPEDFGKRVERGRLRLRRPDFIVATQVTSRTLARVLLVGSFTD